MFCSQMTAGDLPFEEVTPDVAITLVYSIGCLEEVEEVYQFAVKKKNFSPPQD